MSKRILIVLILALLEATASAEPVDLGDPTPRWVRVAFEVSPRSQPGRLDTAYTLPLQAWLEPAGAPGQVQIRVAGRLVEQHLLAGQRPEPRSFSDFVWIFDARSGDVVSAGVRGTLVQHLRLGFLRSNVRTEIEIEMSTRRRAGFQRAREVLGQLLFGFCSESGDPGCTLVRPRGYDGATGYVNAVGELEVQSRLASIRTFSPLGEAVFSEAADASEATMARLDASQPVPASASETLRVAYE